MTEQDVYYAGFWKRIFASVVDAVLQVLVISFPLYFLFNQTNNLTCYGCVQGKKKLIFKLN